MNRVVPLLCSMLLKICNSMHVLKNFQLSAFGSSLQNACYNSNLKCGETLINKEKFLEDFLFFT